MAETKEVSIMEQVKSYEDACQLRGIAPLTIDNFQALPENQREAAFAHHKLMTIAEALNEGHVFNWNDTDEYKYYPWFEMYDEHGGSSGSGFRFDGYGCDHSLSFVGARLCYKSYELAEYAGKQFIEEYKALFKQ